MISLDEWWMPFSANRAFKQAPRLVAKGADAVAARIRAVAEEHGRGPFHRTFVAT